MGTHQLLLLPQQMLNRRFCHVREERKTESGKRALWTRPKGALYDYDALADLSIDVANAILQLYSFALFVFCVVIYTWPTVNTGAGLS